MNIILSESKHHEKPPFMGNKGNDSFSFNIPDGEAFECVRVSVSNSSRYNANTRVVDVPIRGDIGSGKTVKVNWWFDGGPRHSFIDYDIQVCSKPVSALTRPEHKVIGYTPRSNGFHFYNSFPNVPLRTINIGPIPIGIGDASKGMCGGMTFSNRDYFESGIPVPGGFDAPSSGALFDYISERLLDSFDLPDGGINWMYWMDPAQRDNETWASEHNFGPHGKFWKLIHEEWPRVRDDIDHNRLSPIGLVLFKSANPFDLHKNHQVLVYGYTVQGDYITLFIYDPNRCDVNNQVLYFQINTDNPELKSSFYDSVYYFFSINYSFKTPPNTSNCFIQNVGFKSSNGKFLSAVNGGGGFIKANKRLCSTWETFKIEKTQNEPLRSGDLINIKVDNGKYWVAENGGGSDLKADRDNPRKWEGFVLERIAGPGKINTGDLVAFRSCKDQYVCAENGGGGDVKVNRNTASIWERFEIVFFD